MDILLFLVLTGFALIMRYALRNVVAGDYKMFFEPWVATLREAGGGIKGLSAEFEYVDYTTPYLTILSFISICPFLNTLLLMKLVSIFLILWQRLQSWRSYMTEQKHDLRHFRLWCTSDGTDCSDKRSNVGTV